MEVFTSGVFRSKSLAPKMFSAKKLNANEKWGYGKGSRGDEGKFHKYSMFYSSLGTGNEADSAYSYRVH
jgi:hypothetical protein